ncbi:MAG: HAMP domain-containing sensor histidine kinase [Candidatus Omnitrophota bacterium]
MAEVNLRDMTPEQMKALREFSAKLSHDINNALMGVMLLAQGLKVDQGVNDGTLRVLGQMEKGLMRLVDIAARLKMFSRKEELFFENADINEAVKSAVSRVSPEFEADGVSLTAEYADGLPEVRISKIAVRQVLADLLSNARQAVLEKETRQVTISTYLEDNKVMIKVKDSGGVKREHMKRIFEPFFTTRPSGKGLGMGLAIAKGIMEQHGGKIEFSSEEQKGSEFTLSLSV